TQPRRQRRAFSLARLPRILRREILRRDRRLFRKGAGAGLEGGALLVVDDLHDASVPRHRRVWRANSIGRAELSRRLEGRDNVAVGELCGIAVLDILAVRPLAIRGSLMVRSASCASRSMRGAAILRDARKMRAPQDEDDACC